MGDCPDSSLAPLGGPTDEEGCRSWSSWGPWSPCSASCDTGSMSRKRVCPPGDPLYQCRGQDLQRQQCFNTTCPGRGGSHQINVIHLRSVTPFALLRSGRSVAAVGVLVKLQLRWSSGETQRMYPSSLWGPRLLPAAWTVQPSHGNR